MDQQRIIESLSKIERDILPVMTPEFQEIEELMEKTNLDKTTVLRALAFLKNKDLVQSQEKEEKIIKPGINGLHYIKNQLPERKLLDYLLENKSIALNELEKVGLNKDESKATIGILKKKAMIDIKKGRIILNAKKEEITKKSLEEQFLEKLPVSMEELEPQDKLALKNLQARKNIVEIEDQKSIKAKLTEQGGKISKKDLNQDFIEQLTPKIIKTNAWKGKKFRRYDLTSQAPRIYGGKRHFVNQATDHAKKIWLEMGFKEMTGNKVQTSFWVFDALFTAQDHPVREMQDTFFIKDIKGKLPETDKKENLIENIKKAHEGGVDGSKGWQSSWSEEESKRIVLRTHTTCLSAKKLREIHKNNEFPAKYFALGKCFRNETVDWSHGFEFNQTEGIVVDENANFRQLLGYLTEFFNKMGYEKIRIRPGYFPYTEPSLEIDVFHPERKQWVELGGAGMFRPEVTIPIFGKHIPVLAWGPGFDRIIMEFFDIKDLREMYKNNINKLREMKFWK